jgi:hypothetical protein
MQVLLFSGSSLDTGEGNNKKSPKFLDFTRRKFNEKFKSLTQNLRWSYWCVIYTYALSVVLTDTSRHCYWCVIYTYALSVVLTDTSRHCYWSSVTWFLFPCRVSSGVKRGGMRLSPTFFVWCFHLISSGL